MQSYLEDAPLSYRSPNTSRKGKKRSFDLIDGDSKHDGNHQSMENSSKELVLYDPGINDTGHDTSAATGHMDNHTPMFRNFLAPNSSSRAFTAIGTFTVQCASCFKWRIIPTKEKYEQIRERILDEHFVCEHAREWRPDILCEDPEDISQDGSRLWAIDKPNIAQPPSGWERLLRIRGEGGTKFADVYYAAPTGKKLRSMVEVQRYLLEHPEYARQGVTLSQFSFQSPRPLQENYVRKRPPRLTNSSDGGDLVLQKPLEPEAANPLSWSSPPTLKELLVGGSASSSSCHKEQLCSPNESAPPTAMSPTEQMPIIPLHDQPNTKYTAYHYGEGSRRFKGYLRSCAEPKRCGDLQHSDLVCENKTQFGVQNLPIFHLILHQQRRISSLRNLVIFCSFMGVSGYGIKEVDESPFS